jgi:hypothetical protein
MITLEQLESLPLYLDGSDGSLWKSRNDWATVSSEPESAARHYIRVSDLLALLSESGTSVQDFDRPVSDSPVKPPVVPQTECPCGQELPCYNH